LAAVDGFLTSGVTLDVVAVFDGGLGDAMVDGSGGVMAGGGADGTGGADMAGGAGSGSSVAAWGVNSRAAPTASATPAAIHR
jgi:hypothetical protein